MVKQGKFASSTRSMRGKTQRYKATSGQGNINPEDVPEYLMVRYHLTRGKKQSELIEQTILRLLDVLVPDLQANGGNLSLAVDTHLKQASVSVPWQYYKVVVDEWASLSKWLHKELPAVPLSDKQRLGNDLEDMVAMVAKQLAINWWLFQLAGNPQRLAELTEDKIDSLINNFIVSETIDWQVVQTIYSTVQFTPDSEFDTETMTWLNNLSKMG